MSAPLTASSKAAGVSALEGLPRTVLPILLITVHVRLQALRPCGGAGPPTRRRCRLAAPPTCRRRCRWLVLFLFGHMRDFYRKKIWGGREVKKDKEGYAPIRQDYEVRRLPRR